MNINLLIELTRNSDEYTYKLKLSNTEIAHLKVKICDFYTFVKYNELNGLVYEKFNNPEIDIKNIYYIHDYYTSIKNIIESDTELNRKYLELQRNKTIPGANIELLIKCFENNIVEHLERCAF